MRLLKKYIRKFYHLIWFLGSFLLFVPSVFAIPTGEIYTETNTSNITLLSKFQYSSGEVRLYARSGSGQTSPFVPSLNEFYDGNYSLFTYQQIPSGNRTNFGMHFYLNKTLMSGKSYTSTFKVAGDPYTIQYYFSNAISINNANLNSKSIICLSSSCFVSNTFTMSSSSNELHIDFAPLEGLNGQIFVDIFTGIFMVQVEEYNYLDTSGIQNNQQIIINQNDEINDSINSIDDTLNDSSVDNSDNTLNNLNSQLPTNSVISDLLLLPVNLLQAIVNSLGSTCSTFSLGNLYGTNLIMPCIDLQKLLGSSIWSFVDLVFSGIFILVIRKKFIEIFENLTNLRNGGNEVD